MSNYVKKLALDICEGLWANRHHSLLFSLLNNGTISAVDERLDFSVEQLVLVAGKGKSGLRILLHGQVDTDEYSMWPPLDEEDKNTVHVFAAAPDFLRKTLLSNSSLKKSHILWLEGNKDITLSIYLPRNLDPQRTLLEQPHSPDDQSSLEATPSRPLPSQLKLGVSNAGLYIAEAILQKSNTSALFRLYIDGMTKGLLVNLATGQVLSYAGLPDAPWDFRKCHYKDAFPLAVEHHDNLLHISFLVRLPASNVFLDISPIATIPSWEENYFQAAAVNVIKLELRKFVFD